MSDYIVRATAAKNQIRAYAATTRDLVEQARMIHHTSPVATAALGRLLTAGSMMGCMMKNEKDLLTLQIKCDGPIQGLLVTADANANVKGYVYNPDVDLPPKAKGKLDVGKAVGSGILRVIKDLGLKEPYVGQTELVSGEIAEDLTYYFATSEQVPSSVALGVLVDTDYTVRRAGGFILQIMPSFDESMIIPLEKKISEIIGITSLLDADMSPEMIIEQILGGFGVEILDKIPTKYHCSCTKERVEKAIISIGRKDIQEMIDESEPIEVNCHFCNSNYKFDIVDLHRLTAEK
ncbi:MAG: Hsp33 family molecular chaperone HslO [Clostridiales bacterium]|jgi:molecular chaperone Hsp33|nr:Hsp33 family molecular chaperone HslO [Clostridiales bacterium]